LYNNFVIKYILLGFLNYQPMTGYDLKQSIDNSTAHFWHAHHSQIYTTLRQMEQDKLVTSIIIKGESQPERRVYTITDAGKQALIEWLDQSMTEATQVKEELLVRIFFSARRDQQEVLAELRLQRQLHQEKLAAYRRIAETIPEKYDFPELQRDQIFWRATLELGMRYEEMYLGWLNDTMNTIENL
jgi:DNA-binding PadR family transcriptional regulator